MSFASFEYLVLLLATFAVYYFLPWRARVFLLLVSSYIFYCYWEPYYAYIIAFTTSIDYLAALAIEHSRDPRARKAFLVTSIVSNLGILGFFKYTNFVLDTFRPALSAAGIGVDPIHIMLPVGISFYTFQEMSYTIDVYRRRVKPTRDPILFAAYVSFFPQLVAGPIERAKALIPQLRQKHPFAFNRITEGVGLIFIGLAKKLVISDRLWPYGYPKFQNPAAFDASELAISIFVMPIALYLDFAAYTDIARGSAKMFGIELNRNFFFPFAAANPAQYWQRWHITLASWLRDYVFQPLGGVRRKVLGRTTFNFIFVMALLGLWHGASWNFVLWGAGNGVALAAYYFLRIYVFRGSRIGKSVILKVGIYLITLICFLLLAPLFFSPSISVVVSYWLGLLSGKWALGDSSLVAATVFVVIFFVIQFIGSNVNYRLAWEKTPPLFKGLAFAVLFYVVVFGSVPTARRFVYFQF